MMKLAILVLLAYLTTFAVRAQENDALDKLQATYEKEVARVTAPVDRQYHQALLQLQKTLIEANDLEQALEVKREIETLLKKAEAQKTPAETESAPRGMQSAQSEDSTETSEELREWRGDQKRRNDEGQDVLLLEGVLAGTRKMGREIEVGREFPNGLRMRFQYKSDGLPEGGLEIRGVHSNNAFTYRNPTLELDGKWHEYEWPFRDYKGDDKITFEFHVENTEGQMLFRRIEFLEP